MQGRTPTFPGLFLGVGGWVPILCPCGAWEVWLGGWDNRMLTQHNGRENSLGMTRTPSRSPSESLCLGRMTRNDHFSMGTQKTKMFSPSPSLAHRTLSCFVNECSFQSCPLSSSYCTEKAHPASLPISSVFKPESNVHMVNDYIRCRGSLGELRPVFICRTGGVCY